MDKGQLIQLLGSAAALGLLVTLVAWAAIARPTPALDADGARALLVDEFPDETIDAVWIAADGAGVLARSGDRALVLWRKGDGYVARDAAWTAALAAKAEKGSVRLKLADGAPRLALGNAAWPPVELLAR